MEFCSQFSWKQSDDYCIGGSRLQFLIHRYCSLQRKLIILILLVPSCFFYLLSFSRMHLEHFFWLVLEKCARRFFTTIDFIEVDGVFTSFTLWLFVFCMVSGVHIYHRICFMSGWSSNSRCSLNQDKLLLVLLLYGLFLEALRFCIMV